MPYVLPFSSYATFHMQEFSERCPPMHSAFATVREDCYSYSYLYHHYIPLLYRTDPLTTIELDKSTWHHIIATAQARDQVTDRHEHRSCDCAVLDVFANPNRHSDVLQASLGTVTSTFALAPSLTLPAKSRPHHILYQTMETEVHGRIEQIGHLLCPAFFPQSNGLFKKSCRFQFADYLRLRTRQAFTPFTKQSAYLLLMRSICNAHTALVSTPGAHRVSKAAYDAISDQLGPAASETAKIDRLVKQRLPDTVDGSPAFASKISMPWCCSLVFPPTLSQ
jgi:hypothetical protein